MDQFKFIIENERPNLASDNRVALRETIDRIEARIFSKGPSEPVAERSFDRSLLVRLIEVGIELQNIDLLLILVARLKLSQVALIMQSALRQPSDNAKLFVLSHVADYFHIDQPKIKQQLLSLNYNDCDTIFDLKSLVYLFIESNEWGKASEFCEDSQHGPTLNRLICLRLAQQYEAMENFYEALVNYETSETQLENSVRVIIKQFLDSSRNKIKEYCLTSEFLKDFWDEFSFFCFPSSNKDEEKFQSDRLKYLSRFVLKSGLLRKNPEFCGKSITDSLPGILRKLISDATNSKNWLNRRNIEVIVSNTASLDLNTKHRLLTQALQFRQSNCIPEAFALFLCLDESMAASQLSSQFMSYSDVSKLNLDLCLPEASAVNLLRLIRSHGAATSRDQIDPPLREKQGPESVFFSTLNLGLLDETMRCYCDVFLTNEDATKQILDSLENLVAARHNGTLDRIDPTIKAATLSMLKRNLASERIPATPVISIILYCMAIYTYKLDYSYFISVPIRVMRILETMFEHTSDCMRKHNFNAASSLIRSTSILVTAIKDKLEVVSDSDIIRLEVKNIVDAVASRCLVESQFKQAATLYSQIEDHASAVKSLMRLGDIDTVINYSLLVRDITVSRLTLNYLKHLDVDSRAIEEFIAKTKQ